MVGLWKQRRDAATSASPRIKTELPRATLTLGANHSFVLTVPRLGGSASRAAGTDSTEITIEGSWEVDGKEIVCRVATYMGKPVNQYRAAQGEDLKHAQDEFARMQQMGVMGYAGDSIAPRAQSATEALILPERAQLSDDGKRLTLSFVRSMSPSIDLFRD